MQNPFASAPHPGLQNWISLSHVHQVLNYVTMLFVLTTERQSLLGTERHCRENTPQSVSRIALFTCLPDRRKCRSGTKSPGGGEGFYGDFVTVAGLVQSETFQSTLSPAEPVGDEGAVLLCAGEEALLVSSSTLITGDCLSIVLDPWEIALPLRLECATVSFFCPGWPTGGLRRTGAC